MMALLDSHGLDPGPLPFQVDQDTKDLSASGTDRVVAEFCRRVRTALGGNLDEQQDRILSKLTATAATARLTLDVDGGGSGLGPFKRLGLLRITADGLVEETVAFTDALRDEQIRILFTHLLRDSH